MEIAGIIKNWSVGHAESFIDTIGEGAGVYSRLVELGYGRKVYSCKFSESAEGLHDYTGEFEFANMRAYLFWCIRDWLNPMFKSEACLPPLPELTRELVEVKYEIMSNGKILIEPKEKIKERLGRSTDYMDALANTFYPGHKQSGINIHQLSGMLP